MIESLFIVCALQFSNYMPNLVGDKPLPGKINKYITKNTYVLNIALLFVIYFSIKDLSKHEHHNIYTKFKKTFLIWILFLIYIKLPLNYVVIVFIQALVLYFLDEYHEHHLNIEHSEFLDNHYETIKYYMEIIIIITMIIGLISNPPKIRTINDLFISK